VEVALAEPQLEVEVLVLLALPFELEVQVALEQLVPLMVGVVVEALLDRVVMVLRVLQLMAFNLV
jgi:hypothetical protein